MKKLWSRQKRSILRPPYFLLVPYIVCLLIFGIAPAAYALLVSLAKYVDGTPQFFAAGLSNYAAVFADRRLGAALSNLLQFVITSIPFGIILVLFIALLIHLRRDRLAFVARTIYFLPGAVSGPALVLLAIFTLDPKLSPFGPLLQLLGLNEFADMLRRDRLPLVFTVMGFFAGAGGWIAIFYGAFNGIAHEIMEAAIMDGCDDWRLMQYIKLPLVRPYIAYMLLLLLASNIQIFTEPQVLSSVQGTIVSKFWSPNQLAYALAFTEGNFGKAAALSLLMVMLGLIGTLIIVRVSGLFRLNETAV